MLTNEAVVAAAPQAQAQAAAPQDAGLRAALEEIRLLAAQSRLLALNTLIESAGSQAGAAAPEADPIARQGGDALAQAERAEAVVRALLDQIQSNYAVPRIVTGPGA